MTLRVTLYTKKDCHLCEGARALLEWLEYDFAVSIEEVDITADVALYARYREAIPVVSIKGGATLSWPFDEGALRRALTQAGVS